MVYPTPYGTTVSAWSRRTAGSGRRVVFVARIWTCAHAGAPRLKHGPAPTQRAQRVCRYAPRAGTHLRLSYRIPCPSAAGTLRGICRRSAGERGQTPCGVVAAWGWCAHDAARLLSGCSSWGSLGPIGVFAVRDSPGLADVKRTLRELLILHARRGRPRCRVYSLPMPHILFWHASAMKKWHDIC